MLTGYSVPSRSKRLLRAGDSPWVLGAAFLSPDLLGSSEQATPALIHFFICKQQSRQPLSKALLVHLIAINQNAFRKKKKRTFLRGKNKQGGKQVLGVSGWLHSDYQGSCSLRSLPRKRNHYYPFSKVHDLSLLPRA